MIFLERAATYGDAGFTLNRLGFGRQAAISAASWRLRLAAALLK